MSGKWLKDLLNYAARNEVELTPEQRKEMLAQTLGIHTNFAEEMAPSFMKMASRIYAAARDKDGEEDKEKREIMAQMPRVVAGETQKDITSDKPAIRLEVH